MSPEIYPAILTSSLDDYVAQLERVQASGISWVQVDIMDGQFVPSISVMPHEIMSTPATVELEAHLMTFRPERYFSDLVVAGATRVILHREAYANLEECAKALEMAADYFPEVGLAINPETPIEEYSSLKVASIQCMGVHPGASGQTFIPAEVSAILQVKEQKLSAVLALDGGINAENIGTLYAAGVERFVVNLSHFSEDIQSTIQELTTLAKGGV